MTQLCEARRMDVNPEIDLLSDSEASVSASLPVNSAAGAEPDPSETFNAHLPTNADSAKSDTIMNAVQGLTVAVQDLYTSQDIEVRLCWWLACGLAILWLFVLLAWKTYGREIMAVLTFQDKLTRSDSIPRGSSRQSSADEAGVVTEPPAASSNHPHQSESSVQSSSTEPYHPKVD